MAQLLLDNQDSIENEETFIAETARLAELVVKQVALKSECYVTSKGVGASSVSQESLATEEELKVARDLGRQLSDASVKYYKELSSAFDEKTSQIGASFWDINYDAFSVICSNVLRRTIDSVSNRWDQTLLVFAGYNQLREALHGDAIRLNEVSSYIGRYLSDMGFQSWIQLQGGWKHVGQIIPGTNEPPIRPPEGTPV